MFICDYPRENEELSFNQHSDGIITKS